MSGRIIIASDLVPTKYTHIGECCVIGAGTVVKGNIPPHSLVTSDREVNIVQIEKRPV